MPESLFNKPTTMKFTKYDRLWDLSIKPVTDNRYDPHTFHINMWNEWTGVVCTDHDHFVGLAYSSPTLKT